MTRVLLTLILSTSHASFWRSIPMYTKFWTMVLCEKVTTKSYGYEGMPNDRLIRIYLQHGSKASWANKTSKELKAIGNQLRWNHETGGQAALTREELDIMDRYKHFEAEHDGLRPWHPRTVGEK